MKIFVTHILVQIKIPVCCALKIKNFWSSNYFLCEVTCRCSESKRWIKKF